MITKQQYADIEKMSDLTTEYGIDYKQLKAELTKLGLFKEYHMAYIDRQYEKMKENKYFMKKINDKVAQGIGYKKICATRGYTYKAIERYLESIDYIDWDAQEIISEQYRNEIEIVTDYFNNYDRLKDAKEALRNAVIDNGDTCDFGPFKVTLSMGPKVGSISKGKLIKEFGEDKVKELFPELFDKSLKISFSRN